VLLLIGAPGAGKSSALDALATRLEIAGVAHGAIESEELARGFPLLDASRWIAQLGVVLELQREAGRHLFLIAATVEDDEELRELRGALRADQSIAVCLAAPPELLAERLERRESDRWPGKRRLIEHARALAQSVPRLAGIEVVIDTGGRTADDVAAQILEEMRARGLPAPPAEG
jgi:gluconate kinase